MSDYEFWKDLGNIFDAILKYQKKNVDFNNQFINPWIRLGNIFDRDDHLKEAVQAYQHAVEIDPDHAQNWVDLGDAHFKAGAYDEAIVAYTHAVELDPKAGWPLSNLGLTLVTLGKCEDAIPLFLASIDLFPDARDKAVSWNRLGNAYRKLSDYQSAFQAFQKAYELDGENTGFKDKLDETPASDTVVAPEEVLAEMDMDREGMAEIPAAAEAESALSLKPETITSAHVEPAAPEVPTEEPVASPVEEKQEELKAVEIAATVNPEAALPIAETVVEAIPPQESEPLPAWLQDEEQGVVHERTQELEYEDLQEEVPGTEEHVEPAVEEIVAMGEAEPSAESVAEVVEMTNSQEAAPAMEEQTIAPATAVEINLDTSTTTLETAEAYTVYTSTPIVDPSTLEDTQPIRTIRKESLQPPPGQETLAENETRAEASAATATQAESPAPQAVQSQTNEAAYDEYLKDAAEPVSLLTDHVEGLQTAVPLTKVSDSGDVRIAMDTQNTHVWNELGNVYLNSGSLEDAIAAYGRAIELDRQFAWPYSNLALAYVQKGRFAEAILLYQRSIELFESDKDKAVTWNRLGNVYRRMNDYANAIAAYQTADELDPDNATLSLRSHYGLLGNLYMEKKSNYVL